MKFTKDEVIEAVRCILDENRSVQSTAKSIGMAKATLQAYVDRVRIHGYNCLHKSNKNRNYSGDFKVQVLEYVKDKHVSNNEAAAHFNLTRSIIQQWERLYHEEGVQALYEERRGRKTLSGKKRGRPPKLDKQEEEDLIAEVHRLRMENEFLKKLNALVQEREKHENKK